MSTPGEVLAAIDDALERRAFTEVREQLNAIGPGEFSSDQAVSLLGKLRQKRLFSELEKAGGLFLAVKHDAAKLRRLYAQALLDQSRVQDALAVLEVLREEVKGQPEEGEVRGLIGRGFKQRFVDEGDTKALGQAIESYRWGWENPTADNNWHGINLVALLERARRDKIERPSDLDSERIARQILTRIDNMALPDAWATGTALEASIALGDRPSALKWLREYANHEKADEFELASTRRQLMEIWNLGPLGLGKEVLPVLAVAQASRADLVPVELGRVMAADDTVFEAVFGNETPVRLAWVRRLLSVGTSIARVEDKVGNAKGTGFLIRGKDVNAGWGNDLVFVTNAHVVSDDPSDEAPLRIGDAVAHFCEVKDQPKVPLANSEVVFRSTRRELDATVFRIEAPPGSGVLERAGGNPLANSEQRAYVVGHGGGEDLSISLYNNWIREYEDQYVRYESPTKKGHSGSPVLNAQLDVFAFHHAARRSLVLNEGIILDAL